MTSTPQLAQQHEVPLPTLSAPKATEAEFHEPPSSSTVTEESQLHPPPFSNEETEKWGARIMGPPPAPNFHRDNQQAARLMVETGPSVPEAALGKVNLIARALTEDGFESLLKLIFETDPGEKLEKTSNWPCW
uniref:Uncharacterized protein n=1 Tax=Salix viminalis TaxID=40686 RepID=A0A6N2K9Y6_SALVM